MTKPSLAAFLLGWAICYQKPCYSADFTPKIPHFPIGEVPTKVDWQFFMSSSPAWKAELWRHHRGNSRHLRDWAWSWRLAWLKSCGESAHPWCPEVLSEGLHDRALVVRAEAVEILGRRYAGSHDKSALALLAEAYANPANLRNGKPLYIQRYILYAMHGIGGAESQLISKQLASAHAATEAYWQKLRSARERG